MKVLLTGGSGNLGHTLVPGLLDRGDIPVILDVRAPRDLKRGALFIERSILDRAQLTDLFRRARPSLALPAGEIPAPARGEAAPPEIEPWADGGNDMS